MNKPNLGVVYCANNDYVMPTCISLCSVLENNRNAPTNEQVELSVHIFAENWTEKSVQIITEMTKKYSVDLFFYNPEKIIEKLQKLDPEPWCGTYSADVRLYVAEYIDVDYNICCLDSDVIMNKNQNLYELAVFNFENEKKCCASTIDMQSSPIVKKESRLKENEHIYNTNGIFLLNPKLYIRHKVIEAFETASKDIALIYKPYKDVLRNAYALKGNITPLPMKYQVYPGQKLLKIPQWLFLFALNQKQYYSKNEIEAALKNPVFIHFVNFIVQKPWYISKIRDFPFFDIWEYYRSLTVFRDLVPKEDITSGLDMIKLFFYKYLRIPYVLLCASAYRLEVMQRNKKIRNNIKEHRS